MSNEVFSLVNYSGMSERDVLGHGLQIVSCSKSWVSPISSGAFFDSMSNGVFSLVNYSGMSKRGVLGHGLQIVSCSKSWVPPISSGAFFDSMSNEVFSLVNYSGEAKRGMRIFLITTGKIMHFRHNGYLTRLAHPKKSRHSSQSFFAAGKTTLRQPRYSEGHKGTLSRRKCHPAVTFRNSFSTTHHRYNT
jgi:hypothetical protein